MDEEAFRSYCIKRNVKEETIQAHIRVVKDFEGFLKNKYKNKGFSSSSPSDMQSFVAHLMENKKNTIDSFVALLRYAIFVNKRELVAFLFGFIEGFGALEKLSGTLKQTVGESKRDEIFEGINLPPLGTDPKDKPKVTKRIMERLEAALDEETLKEIMSSGLDVGPKEWYSPMREKFLKSKSIDDFLKKRHEEAVELLEKHSREKSMFYAQEINEEVVEYVRNNQAIMGGVREGDIIYETKIPYMTKKYLHEKDEEMKRYYACHCAWVRETIKSGLKISPNFCYCSAGYHKRPWDIIFAQPVKADVIETVLKGDLVCRFAIHIPKQFLESKGATQKM
ncbi:MAG: phage integrase N-terminal SAM-like domain-containing protein [Candidatus Bathyarchaeota archaeon]|nr:phage integrase N-terminal SAM-like domain-containing protein [Candidatus Bathyarchaeota archaeon]